MRTPTAIIQHIADELGVECDRVRSNDRTPTPTRARRIAVYVLRRERGLSYGEIAKALRVKRQTVWRCYWTAEKQPDAEIAKFLGGDA